MSEVIHELLSNLVVAWTQNLYGYVMLRRHWVSYLYRCNNWQHNDDAWYILAWSTMTVWSFQPILFLIDTYYSITFSWFYSSLYISINYHYISWPCTFPVQMINHRHQSVFFFIQLLLTSTHYTSNGRKSILIFPAFKTVYTFAYNRNLLFIPSLKDLFPTWSCTSYIPLDIISSTNLVLTWVSICSLWVLNFFLLAHDPVTFLWLSQPLHRPM